LKILFFLLAILLPSISCAKPFFPNHASCTDGQEKSENCEIVLNENGFLVEASTGSKFSEVSENMGAMSSNWLYKYGEKYILEHLDFSSSKSRSWVVFSYVGKKISFDRVYSFSQVISPASIPVWYGYECRVGEKSQIMSKDKTFSEAAVSLLCGDAAQDNLELEKETPDSSVGVDIAIKIPVYKAGKIDGSATYLFFDSNKPDVFQMACYSNCELKSDGVAIAYIGRVSEKAWFIGDLKRNSCSSKGGYKYKPSSERIVFEGCVDSAEFNVTEYAADGRKQRALFVGKAYGDGYKGDWISKVGDNKKYSFFMFPLTVY